MDSYISDITTDNTSMEGVGETTNGDRGEREETVSPEIVKKLKGKGKEEGEVPDMKLEEGDGGEHKSATMNGLRISTSGHSEPSPEVESEDKEEEETTTFDSPVDHDSPQMMDSPVDEKETTKSGPTEEEVQIFHSPVEDEADQVPVVRNIKGRPRPRPRP